MRARLASAALGAALGGLPAVGLAWWAERVNAAFLDHLSSFWVDVLLPGALLGALLGLAIGRGSLRGALLAMIVGFVEMGALDALALTKPSPGQRPVMIVLLVDGLGSAELAATDLPELAAGVASGASGVLRAEPPLWPASVLAALVTGRPASHHGVHAWQGREEPAAAAGILEIAEHEGLVVEVEEGQPPAPSLTTWAAVQAEVQGGTRWSTLRDRLLGEAQDRLSPPDSTARQVQRVRLADRRARDGFLFRLAQSPPDLALLRIGGVDALAHLSAVRGEALGSPARAQVDEILAELRDAIDPRGWLVLGSGWAVDATGTHQPDGLLLIVGPGVAAGTALGTVEARDFAPTLLGLLSLPAAVDMKGKAIFGTSEAPVATWDALAPAGPPSEDEGVARTSALRGLGYAE